MAGAIANLSASLKWDLDDFQRGTASVENAFKGIIGIAGDMATAVANAGRKMTIGLTLPLAGIAALTTKAASDAAELQSAFNFTFGAMAGSMNKWAEATGDAMGRSTQQMQQGAFALGGLFKAAAPTEQAAARLSKSFTELAVDAGSFFNVPFDEALSKIRSGLAGESEPLRAFNVFLTETAVKTKAVEMGLITAGQELDEYGKVMARAILIQEGLNPALGDAERTAGSLANSLVRLKAQIGELATEIGQYLEPYAKALAATAERLVTWFKELPEGVKKAAIAFGVFLAALGPLSIVLSALAVTLLPLVLVGMGPLFVAISAIINPIGTLVVILGKWIGLMGGVGAAISQVAPMLLRFLGPVGLVIAALQLFGGSIVQGLQNFAGAIANAVGPRIQELFARLSELSARLSDAFDALMASPVGDFIEGVGNWISWLIEQFGALLGYLTGSVLSGMLDVLNGIIEAITGMVDVTVSLLTGDWQGAWDGAVDVVGRAAIRISEWISGLFPNLSRLLGMIGALSGAKLTTPGGGGGVGGGGGASDPFASSLESVAALGAGSRDYAMPGKTKTPKAARSGRRGRSGPSAAELADRRDDIRLQNEMEIARETGDLDAIRRLERQIELKQRIQEYERAGLSTSLAKVAAERDLVALDQAVAVADAKSLKLAERDLDMQLAELRNDFEHSKFMQDEEYLERRILELQRAGKDAAEAEIMAKRDLLLLDEARADLAARRLADEEETNRIELARMRGDDENSIRGMEEAQRMRQRAEALRADGVSPEEAEAQALREGSDRAKAHIQGNFRDAFRNGLQAALDGNLGDYFEGWMRDRTFNALSKVLDRLADSLANLISGQSGGGGLGSILAGVLGLSNGGGSSGGVSGAILPSTSNYGRGLPKLNTGGMGTIKGHPGIDKNLLQLNGSPVAWVSRGENLSVQPMQNGGSGGGKLQVEVIANNNGFGAIIRNHAGQVVAESAPAMMAGASQVTQSAIAYRNTRRVA